MLRAYLFGQFALSLDDQPIDLPGRSVQLLFIFLLLNPEISHRREKIAGLLWPETSEANARSNLRGALWRARKAFETAGIQERDYLQADDQTIQLVLQPGDWLDNLVLDEKITAANTADDLIRMVAVYGGELLPGFYEDWIVSERQRLQGVYERTMGLLLDRLLTEHRWQEVLQWGERWIAQGSLPEPAYRGLMLAHAGLGDLAGAVQQYQRCVEVLDRELGVGPSDQTRQALRHIQAGRVKETGKKLQADDLAGGSVDSPEIPDFLKAETIKESKPQLVFVGRDEPLAVLDRYLDQAISGKGQLVFVSGEAGSGKSTLLQAFVRRAVADHPDLVAAYGTCNAFFGQGDAYLPFREVLEMLTGEAERAWRSGLISRDHARRLWVLLPAALQVILEAGPGLVDSLVTGQALLGRAEAALPVGNPWRKELEDRLARRLGGDRMGQGQAGLIEQYLQVLRRLAEKQTIIIALDDLQWVDSGSVQLMFHLARQIQDARILILGAFRPEEVAAGRAGDRNVLEPLLHECQRIYGDILLDLDQVSERSGRVFVNALLDVEPNFLDEDFRSELYRRTRGQPLFTNQLLRDLQERGAITLDVQDHWIAPSELNWEVFPPQVEGVIGERLGRLDHELQEILSVASVEGEEFTVQVLERLQEYQGRELLRRLSRDLEKRHRLVRELGEVQVGHQRLARFRFTHALIQEYLYRQLGESERRMLHGEVAAALEKLYAGDPGSISVQLARHYAEAGEKSRAIRYLLQAGDQAHARYAHQEAIAHYQQALAFQKELGDTEGAAHSLLKLNLVYHSAFDFQQAGQVLQEGLALWQQAARPGIEPALPLASQPYRLSREVEVTLDPAYSYNHGSSGLISKLFCGLVEISGARNVVPMAAKSWEVGDEGRRYIFHLRQDLYWNDGTPLTARDFEYAWKRILDPVTQSVGAEILYDLVSARSFHQGQISDASRIGVTASDPFTLVVELEKPAGYFPYVLTRVETFAVPEHAVRQFGENWTDPGKIVSSGAYQLDAWEPGRIMRFSRNPFYPDRYRGNIDRVEIIFYPDNGSAYADFVSGDLDMIRINHQVNFSQADREYDLETGQVNLGDYNGVNATYFNINHPLFNDLQLRKALVLATDREALARESREAFVIPATNGYVPPAIPGNSPGIGLPYDPDEARRLIAAAGFPQGRGLPQLICIVDEIMKESPLYTILCEQWEQNLGIHVKLESRKNGVFARMDDHYHLALGFWFADFPDPESILGANPYMDKFRLRSMIEEPLEAGRRSLDQISRLEFYRQIDRMLVEQAYVLPNFYCCSQHLMKPWVHIPRDVLDAFEANWKDIILDPH